MDMSTLNKHAKDFKALHQPGRPVILANVYDIPSARTVAALPSCKALATASYAVALAAGTEDTKLTLECNLQAVRVIGRVACELGKPLTVDLQDGYGGRLEEAITGIIERGAVGCNLEDSDRETGVLMPIDEAVDRIRRTLTTAHAEGVLDFVVNARCDVLLHGGSSSGSSSSDPLDEVVRRGKKYLAAGATSVFVLGGSSRGGVTAAEVERLAREFNGRLNVSCVLAPGNLSVRQIADLGVCRISVGPQMLFKATDAVKREADMLLGGIAPEA